MTIATALGAALLALSLAAPAADRPENFVQWREGLASSAQPKAEWLNGRRADVRGAGEPGASPVARLETLKAHGKSAELL